MSRPGRTAAYVAVIIKGPMKYVCTECGKMLSVDRDVDEDRTFDFELYRHRKMECPRAFTTTDDVPWLRPSRSVAPEAS